MSMVEPHTKYALIYLLVIAIISLLLTSLGAQRSSTVDPVLGLLLSVVSIGLLVWILFVLIDSLIDDRLAELDRSGPAPATGSTRESVSDTD